MGKSFGHRKENLIEFLIIGLPGKVHEIQQRWKLDFFFKDIGSILSTKTPTFFHIGGLDLRDGGSLHSFGSIYAPIHEFFVLFIMLKDQFMQVVLVFI